MILALGRRDGAVSPKAVTAIIAAIVLVLHWAAPVYCPLEIGRATNETTPSISSADWIKQRGSLPRVLARNLSFDNALPRSKLRATTAAGNLVALTVPYFRLEVHGVLRPPPDCSDERPGGVWHGRARRVARDLALGPRHV
jgi:hypothetical protein